MNRIGSVLKRLAAAVLTAIIAAAFCACGLFGGPLTEQQIRSAVDANEYDSEAQRTVVESAVSLAGKVTYFWGGKSFSTGPDPEWGTPRKVTSEGHSTTGETIPYGLDCSGFVQWCFAQLGLGKEWTSENVGEGTWHQWVNSEKIEKTELKPGDIVFSREYPGAKSNHVGIVIGFSSDGEPLIAHCSPSYDSVVVTPCGDTFGYYRRFRFLNG